MWQAQAAGRANRVRQLVRAALVVGYLGTTALAFLADWQPRFFWTMLLPLLPMALVLMGFANWRRICPLAFWGELGQRLNRGPQRRMPRALEAWVFPATFAFLGAMLVLRLVATNGDGRWLGGLLIALAILAAATNLVFTGKTWCNFLCPVGLTEAIYTEPGTTRPDPGPSLAGEAQAARGATTAHAGGHVKEEQQSAAQRIARSAMGGIWASGTSSLPRTQSSQCERCTGCKKNCPDIGQENAYWKDVEGAGRRFAYYAFPGLVVGFYSYYWLRHGDWEAYFDGRWTRAPATLELALGPGFFFAPAVPAVAAAALTLAAFSLASLAIFFLAERATRRLWPDRETRRHALLALAGFAAFNLFYFFAGAPTLRQLPGGARLIGFAAPMVATLALVQRWRRTRVRFLQETGAAKLLRQWPFAEPPPTDPAEVFASYKAQTQAREKSLAAYRSTIRDMLQEGLVTKDELRLLEQVRSELGITEREHERMVAELSEDERRLFDPRRAPDLTAYVQAQGYQKALSAALVRGAPAEELEQLRAEYGVGPQAHAEALERIRSASGELVERARELTVRAAQIQADLRALRTLASPAAQFIAFALAREREAVLARIINVLEVAAESAHVERLRPGLLAADPRLRQAAVDELGQAARGIDGPLRSVVAALAPILLDGETPGATPVNEVLARLRACPDRYLRAGAVLALAEEDWGQSPGTRNRYMSPGTVPTVADDPDPLVREAAARCARAAPGGQDFSALSVVEKMIYLRRVPIFSDLEPEVLHELCALVSEETVGAGEVICREGEPGDDLFVVVSGRFSVVAGEPQGTPREIAVRGPGEVVGELSVIDGNPRSATLRPAGSPVRLLRVDGRGFRERLLHRPDVSAKVVATLAQRLRDASR